ncbi:MAG: chorismate-binding protein, partial [Muribaculaceae bacterium]|nr:chorismate-binding protein [Muribaculaceae bacterium]
MTQRTDSTLLRTVQNIDYALKAHINFFAYRMPGLNSKVYFGASTRLIEGLADNAFVIGAFDNSSLFSIPADYTDLGNCCIHGECHIDNRDIPPSTSRADHCREVETIRKHLFSAGGGKVVAARALTTPKYINVSKSFAALCQAYPTAFVSCFCSSHSGLWLGASPETLLRLHDDRLETMALAGTRPRTNNPDTPHPFNFSAPDWDSKNIEEQQLVVDFICRTMLDNSLQPRASWRFTRTAGPVEHN